MPFKKWSVSKCDKALAKSLAEECGIGDFTALIASGRGYTDPLELEEFVSDDILIYPPYDLIDIVPAVSVISDAIENNEKIGIFGDYDCDGVTATALLYRYLKGKGASVFCLLPNRFTDGYGINKPAIDEFKRQGVSLIITVDNGISSAEEIDYANSLGLKTVVTDHHLPPEKLPNAAAVVDPHRNDCPSAFKDISGVGVAFKLICAIEDASPEEMILEYGDLVAIGTVGDVMPLTCDNRSFVKAGLQKIKTNSNIGVSALLKASGASANTLTATTLSFTLVPRLNAAGRMKSADLALRLLICDNIDEAEQIADEINTLNTKRQEIGQNIFAEAQKIIEENGYEKDRVIVVDKDNWHKGVIGIVAAKLSEKYLKPCIVISKEGNEATGSGRSPEGFSLYDCMASAKDCLIKYGGHASAAGISLNVGNISVFRKAVNKYASKSDAVIPEILIDCKLNPSIISIELVDEINLLEPFGNGNPPPVFGIYGLTLDRITPTGNGKHLRLTFTRDNLSFQALYFGMSEDSFPFCVGDNVEIAVNIDKNNYNGNTYVTVKIIDIRPANTLDEVVVVSINEYISFVNEKLPNLNICPTRSECGTVYRFISSGEKLSARAENYFLNTLGYAKYNIIKDILLELGLIKEFDGRLSAVGGVQSDLANSEILKCVRGDTV